MGQLNRISRIAVATALGGALVAPVPLRAQQAPSPDQAPAGAPAAAPAEAPAAQPNGAAPAADPPARAGRIARINGTVSFHGPGEDHWEAATLNFPVTDGDALWTEPQATAAMDVSASRLTLAGGTELDVDKLDATSLTLTIPQGEVFLRLNNLVPGESYTVATPRGTVTITQAGAYEIAAGDQASPTLVTVLAGQAQVAGANLTLTVQPNQTATITGEQNFTGNVGAIETDAFLTAMQPPPAAPAASVPATPTAQAAPPPAVQDMPGAEDLNQAGNWQPSPQYGNVWYPNVAPGWAPYREGRWAYVAPWGWTWVDAAPWGFAPFHYGRWVEIDQRWAWTPAYAAPGVVIAPAVYAAPVYAPALVGFFGFGAGVGVGIGVGIGVGFGVGIGASVGWVPLGWGEPFHPWYGGGPGYIQNINRTSVSNVTNITNINRNTTINNYANARAATVVPASAMTSSAPVAAVAKPATAQQLASARPITTQPVKPTAATAGVTPAVAHNLGLPPAHAATGAHAPTPGPAIHPAAAGATAGHTGAPTLAPPGGAHGTTPAAAGPHPAGTTPGAARPGAPGPAITPHAPGTATAPALRAPGNAAAPHPAGTAAAGKPGTTTATPGHAPAAGGAAAHTPGPVEPHRNATPTTHGPSAPQVSHPTPQAARPAPAVQHPAPQHAAPPHPAPQRAAPPHPAPQAHAAPVHAPPHNNNCKPGQKC